MSTTRGDRNRREISHTPPGGTDTSLLLSEREHLDEAKTRPHTLHAPRTDSPSNIWDQGWSGGAQSEGREKPCTSVILSTHSDAIPTTSIVETHSLYTGSLEAPIDERQKISSSSHTNTTYKLLSHPSICEIVKSYTTDSYTSKINQVMLDPHIPVPIVIWWFIRNKSDCICWNHWDKLRQTNTLLSFKT